MGFIGINVCIDMSLYDQSEVTCDSTLVAFIVMLSIFRRGLCSMVALVSVALHMRPLLEMSNNAMCSSTHHFSCNSMFWGNLDDFPRMFMQCSGFHPHTWVPFLAHWQPTRCLKVVHGRPRKYRCERQMLELCLASSNKNRHLETSIHSKGQHLSARR